jgi:hypothetical protein
MFSLSERNEANACEHLRALLIGVTMGPIGGAVELGTESKDTNVRTALMTFL